MDTGKMAKNRPFWQIYVRTYIYSYFNISEFPFLLALYSNSVKI